MSVPFVDLAVQYQALRPELEPAMQAVLERGAFVMGAELIETVVSALRAALRVPAAA